MSTDASSFTRKQWPPIDAAHSPSGKALCTLVETVLSVRARNFRYPLDVSNGVPRSDHEHFAFAAMIMFTAHLLEVTLCPQ